MLKNITHKTNYLAIHRNESLPWRPGVVIDRVKQVVEMNIDSKPNPLVRPLVGKAYRYYNPLDKFRNWIPLEFDNRNVAINQYKRGAIVAAIDGWSTYVYLCDGDNNYRLFDYGYSRFSRENHELPTTGVHIYKGHLPECFIESALAGERIMTDDVLIESEYSRGPKVRVSVHHRQPIDLDPQTVTFAQLKELDLANLQIIKERYGFDILEMPDNDLLAQLLVRHLTLDPQRRKVAAVESFSNAAYNLFYRNWEEQEKRVMFPTYGEEPGTLSYFNGYADFIRGRETVAKAGKVLKKLNENSSDATIKSYVDRILIAQLPDSFYHLTTSSEIIGAYRNGPSSCTSKPLEQYSVYRRNNVTDESLHPVCVYGDDSDIQMMVMKKGDRIMARCLIVPAKMKRVAVYPKDAASRGTPEYEAKTALEDYLDGLGYTFDQQALLGCVTNRRQLPVESPQPIYAHPYIDHSCYNVILVGDEHNIVYSAENYASTFNEALTPRARQLLIDNMPEGEQVTLGRIAASHDMGANYVNESATLSRIGDTVGMGAVVTVIENGVQSKKFKSVLDRADDHVRFLSDDGSEYIYYRRDEVRQHPPVSRYVALMLNATVVTTVALDRVRPDLYARFDLANNPNIIYRDGRYSLREEYITFNGEDVHIENCIIVRKENGYTIAPLDRVVNSAEYLREVATLLNTENGVQHEAA